jgi:hypothetical protein
VTTLATASYRVWRPSMGQAVVTSRGLPRWRLAEASKWPRCWMLAPARSLWGLPREEFRGRYFAQLEEHGAEVIARQLERTARQTGADRLVLLCFEPVVADCHRGDFAAWWLVTTGERVEELLPGPDHLA